MITLFRRIRAKLIDSGSGTKYLLYAVGEILLVVIGILIALQVNNWNTNRLDHIEETALLMQLKTEFLSNKTQLEEKIALREQGVNSILHVLQMIDDEISYATGSSELDSLLAAALPVYTFDPQYGVMNQLLQAGKLSLVQSDSLRELLANWSGIVADLKETENDYSSFNRNDYRPFLYRQANYRSIISSRIRDGVVTPTLFNEQFDNTTEIGNSVNPADADLLLDSKEFENYMASLYSYKTYLNSQSNGVIHYINNIVEWINSELEP